MPDPELDSLSSLAKSLEMRSSIGSKSSSDPEPKSIGHCFSSVGDVSFVELFNDENNKPRGCGIVEFVKAEHVQAALEKMNRYDINGRNLVIKEDYGNERDKFGRVVPKGGNAGGGGGGGRGNDFGGRGLRDDDRMLVFILYYFFKSYSLQMGEQKNFSMMVSCRFLSSFFC